MTASGLPSGGGEARQHLVFAYSPAAAQGVFTSQHFDTLKRLCAIEDAAPLESFEDDRARRLLAEAEILVTGWGSPQLDATLLGLAPRLKLIAHAAGSVRNLVAPEIFAAGIKVCNAPSANAVPVAEFTLAAILFSNKQVLRFRDAYRRDRETTSW